jgi:hypothetical protein
MREAGNSLAENTAAPFPGLAFGGRICAGFAQSRDKGRAGGRLR